MSTVLIRHACLNGRETDLFIKDGVFHRIAPILACQADTVLEAAGKIIVPPFYNCHTHAGMTLLRGYADDMELFTWLNRYIWPAEARLKPDDIYHGTRLAILEMIRSGTLFFNDMYWHSEAALRAVEEMGVRAALGRLFIEESVGKISDRNISGNAALEARYHDSPARNRVLLTYAPHAIYTVSGETLREIAQQATAEGAFIHTHVAETRQEVTDCHKAHDMSPVAWLDACGILGPKTVLAHCVHLTADDIALIRDRGATVVHMPWSNAKLASGQFDYRTVVEEGSCRFAIGTDGCASNNSLSMFGEMKAAALLAKLGANDPACAKDTSIWEAATRGGAAAFGLNAGIIAEGALADALLLNPDNPLLVPNHHLAANMVYSADSSCVDSAICAGRVLMENRHIEGEAEILAAARDAASRICT